MTAHSGYQIVDESATEEDFLFSECSIACLRPPPDANEYNTEYTSWKFAIHPIDPSEINQVDQSFHGFDDCHHCLFFDYCYHET